MASSLPRADKASVNQSFHALMRLLRYAKGYRRQIITATICSIINKLFDIAPEILIGVAIDVVVNQESSFVARLGFESLTLEEALAAEPERLRTDSPLHLQEHSYVSRSRYVEQLDRYEELFSAQQLLVMKSEAMFADPATTWQQIESFLGLPTSPCPSTLAKANSGQDEANGVSAAIRSELRQQLKATALEVRERYEFGWDWA